MSIFRLLFNFLWKKRALVAQGVFLFCVVMGWLFFQRDAVFDYLDSQDRFQLEKARTDGEAARVRDLEGQRGALSSGAQGSEGVVRQAYYLTRPDEEVLILEQATDSAETSPSLPGDVLSGPGIPGLDLPSTRNR